MRRGICLFLPAVAAFGLLVGGGQAQTGAREETPGGSGDKKTSLFSRFPGMGGKKAATDKTPAATGQIAKQKADSGKGAAKELKQTELAARVLKEEQATYLRREAVCDKLREIARDTNDDKLLRLADQLNELAWDTYKKRTADVAAVFGETHGEIGKQPNGKSGQIAARKDKQ